MQNTLLVQVLSELVCQKEAANEYGVSIINIPEFDYVDFACRLSTIRDIEFFFLGFSTEDEKELKVNLPKFYKNSKYTYSFSTELAEESRNSGNEEHFRILIIRRSELEKLSSLRWFPEITVDMVYNHSCKYVESKLGDSNSFIKSIITALKRKSIRKILGFENVMDYLNCLVNAPIDSLFSVVKDDFYKLGLLNDNSIDQGNPTTETIVSRIKRNHEIVEKIGNLEQTERQSITNYYSSESSDKKIPGLILNYYSNKNALLLGNMELSQVEACLKAAKKKPNKTKTISKTYTVNSTALASQLIFDDNPQQIESVLSQMESDVDNRSSAGKKDKIDIDVDGVKLQVRVEPTTEKIAKALIDEMNYGGIIHADVNSPDEAISDIEKYDFEPFNDALLDIVQEKLGRIADIVPDGENISSCLKVYLTCRKRISRFSTRLQDAPMFSILANMEIFKDFLCAYESLLIAINNDYAKILNVNAASSIKYIINTIISLDNIFVVSEKNIHAIQTPLNPLYLWKYIKLAEEILESKGVDETNENILSDVDKSFIIRKADDIPDPLSVMLVPYSVNNVGGVFLPLVGRIGNIPVYSTNKQINQSESGIDSLKQSIIRYLCLYPHAGMMLKVCIIDPPSIELVVSMLKKLNGDREFNISGIDLSLYRTKECPSDWSEISDDSLNNGMLGQYKGKRNLNFRIKIANKTLSYSKILSDISNSQHIMIIFDPNEIKINSVKNNRHIHIHPLCVPMIYQYNAVDDEVSILPSNEGDVFSTYGSIVEKLNEHPSSFSHTSSVFKTPLKRETFDNLLCKSDWLIILDQSLKTWDISLRAASEKLFYKENDYRSIGIYSKNSKKFIQGYKNTITSLGNFIPKDKGIANVIEAIRSINDDGLLSIVSHSSNRIFDENHGKGSLGLAIAAIDYMKKHPSAILVGLDTQLAKEWLSGRDDNQLPDLVGICLDELSIDIIEVKTYDNNDNSFVVRDGKISGHAVVQSTILEKLINEMIGHVERITTISRREILRQQVYESLFQSIMEPKRKRTLCEQLNSLFAGEYEISINKQISFVDFEKQDSLDQEYEGDGDYAGNKYHLRTIGSDDIQSIVSAIELFRASDEQKMRIDKSEVNNDLCENASLDNICSDLNQDNSAAELKTTVDKKEIIEKCIKLNKLLKDFNISAFPVNPDLVQETSRFTRFSVELKSGESIRAIEKSREDLAIQLEANGEILVDHILGTKYISVDVPFANAGKPICLLNYLNQLDGDKNCLNVVAGQKPDGKIEILDIAKGPHLLVAGTTGSGKTIFLYSIMVSLLEQFSKYEIEFLIVDPKMTDFVFFDDLPNLYGGKVVTDADEALELLNKINEEDKEERMKLIRSCKSRDINSYNEKNPNNRMKRLVVIIDEYADLIQTAEMQGSRKEFERSLSMLAQKVRSLGIHLIIATQRPSANIVTGVLKANIPYRISFRLPSHTDSLTILDMPGAENLLGRGDMLVVTDSETKRMQGLFIEESELEDYVKDYVKKNEF